jgi:hypothetical protein
MDRTAEITAVLFLAHIRQNKGSWLSHKLLFFVVKLYQEVRQMAWIKHNVNPQNNRTGDCVIRALSTALGQSWYKTSVELFVQSVMMCSMMNANHVWGAYLKRKGFKRYIIDTDCPDCYTVKDFCEDNPKGTFIMAISGHVVAVIDGNYYDTWDSGGEIPVFYWCQRKDEK